MQHLGHSIYHIKNFYKNYKEFYKEVLKIPDQAKWVPLEEEEAEKRNASYFLIEEKNTKIYEFFLDINQCINTKLSEVLNKTFINQWDLNKYNSIGEIIKYEKGGVLKPHRDMIHNSQELYSFSTVFYLNDDFEGGETFFSEKNIFIKPQSNSLSIFPSNLWHCSTAIINGTKLVYSSFHKEIKNAN